MFLQSTHIPKALSTNNNNKLLTIIITINTLKRFIRISKLLYFPLKKLLLIKPGL